MIRILKDLLVSSQIVSLFISPARRMDPNILYLDNNIKIKNLALIERTGTKSLNFIEFDIMFLSTSCYEKITIHSPYSDRHGIKQIPFAQPDWRQGMQFQHICLECDEFFSKTVFDGDILRVEYGNQTLFEFETVSHMICQNYYEFDTLQSLPESLIFDSIVCSPCIKRSKVVSYFHEYVDISKIDFKNLQNHYYGRFPHENIRIKLSTDYYDSYKTQEELYKIGYGRIGVNIQFENKKFNELYYKYTSRPKDKKFFKFEPYRTIEDYSLYKFSIDNDSLTFEDGTMRDIDYPNYLFERNKPSKFITYPMVGSDYTYYYNQLKNSNINLFISGGYNLNFYARIKIPLNIMPDLFYNHLLDYSIEGNFFNEELDTVDKIYA